MNLMHYRRTWLAVGHDGFKLTDEETDYLLWSATAFPFARPRMIYYQLQHALRHQVCIDDPAAACNGGRCR